ncbi:hypothetical protein GCM10009821_06600 [Aeromicrobium halocynthiae]|uniref:Putative Flp pilus-assembly TadG-like N-terminal domain-containing protein n=1 Tax=Aeromicrobium halocynthiae TaxID=560557 RepID=A0ABN2VSY8_9ACTN
MRARGEQGNVSVTTVGFLVVIGLMTVLVVNASAAFLAKQELNNLADGAALTAADGLDEAGFYAGADVRLEPSRARELVGRYLAGRSVQVVDVVVDDDTVRVALERDLRLLLVPPGWFDSTRVTAEATSQLRQLP